MNGEHQNILKSWILFLCFMSSLYGMPGYTAVQEAKEDTSTSLSIDDNESSGEPRQISLSTDLSSTTPAQRYYSAAQRAFDMRAYHEAEKLTLLAIKEAKKTIREEPLQLLSRNLLGDIYVAQEESNLARSPYEWTLPRLEKQFGNDSIPVAQCLRGLAQVYMTAGDASKAEVSAKRALLIEEKQLGPDSHDCGLTLITLGKIYAKQGWNKEAGPIFERGLSILQKHPGSNDMDFAEALRTVALYCEQNGSKTKSAQFFDQSYLIKDKSVYFDQPARLKGEVRYIWEEGSPRAQVIPDANFPLKYICVNGVRVATTIVDLWELFGVLISVTNIGDQRIEIGLDKVSLERPDLAFVKERFIESVDPSTIDHIQREKTIWDLTQNRPWLANIQKTRSVRGLVPAHGHDLFRGPNVFGIYRNWEAVTRTFPDRFAIEASPERVQYQSSEEEGSLIRSNINDIAGLYPIFLEPFESRTGVLFYMNPRCENLLIRIPVGNATFEFPFTCGRRRIK
jgi:tetratricopeptide (TPR) repeat protein